MRSFLSVRPKAAGWVVEADLPGFPQTHNSGARAEQAALRCAEQQADAGRPTEVRVFLRDGSLGGRFLVCAPDHKLALEPVPFG